MFLEILKNFWIKKKVKDRITSVSPKNSNSTIKHIGLLIDESNGLYKNDLLKQLQQKGFSAQNISVLTYLNSIPKTDKNYTIFCFKDLNWDETFKNQSVKQFIETKFDLLINYYNQEKAPLLLVTQQSQAHFKVGFSQIDNKFNQLIIATEIENNAIFVDELFKYLKILNKL